LMLVKSSEVAVLMSTAAQAVSVKNRHSAPINLEIHMRSLLSLNEIKTTQLGNLG
jgi:hypothetical protein